jgi:hypothetical protein
MRFRSLSEAVRYNLDNVLTTLDAPGQVITQGMVSQAASETYSNASDNIFRWGESTWGINQITGDAFPFSNSTNTGTSGSGGG